jgi:hypothetical protein
MSDASTAAEIAAAVPAVCALVRRELTSLPVRRVRAPEMWGRIRGVSFTHLGDVTVMVEWADASMSSCPLGEVEVLDGSERRTAPSP